MTTNTKTTNGSKPTHIVYHVQDREDDKPLWTPIGAAWPNRDGKGFNIQIDALPVPFNGRLTVRERKNKEEGR